MDKSMSRGTALYFAQPDQVAFLEAAVAVFKFPQSRLGRACMEDVAHLVEAVHIELPHKGGDVGMLEVLRQNFGKLIGRGHDEAFVGVAPGNQVLDCPILQHAIEFMNERGLDYFWRLRRTDSSGGIDHAQ